ncbi:hypothetical protein D3C73_1519220 [compost metagenome]
MGQRKRTEVKHGRLPDQQVANLFNILCAQQLIRSRISHETEGAFAILPQMYEGEGRAGFRNHHQAARIDAVIDKDAS